jgi:hypothetical protein
MRAATIVFAELTTLATSASATDPPPIHWVIENATADGCGFIGGKVDFCEESYVEKIKDAYNGAQPNFNKKFLVIPIVIPFYHDASISFAVVDTQTGETRPLPFAFLEAIGEPSTETTGMKHAQFSLDDSEICIIGPLWAYKASMNGTNCWRLENGAFSGAPTPYIN